MGGFPSFRAGSAHSSEQELRLGAARDAHEVPPVAGSAHSSEQELRHRGRASRGQAAAPAGSAHSSEQELRRDSREGVTEDGELRPEALIHPNRN